MTDAAQQFDYGQAAQEIAQKMEERKNRHEFIEPNMDALRKYADVLNAPVKSIGNVALEESKVAEVMYRRAQILMFMKSKKVVPFVIDDHNLDILRALKLYAMNDIRFEEQGYGSLHKSICLRGLTGCGKSMLLKVLADSAQPWEKHDGKIGDMHELKRKGWGDGVKLGMYSIYDIISCVALEHQYRKDGEKCLAEVRAIKRPVVFDDLGFENSETLNYGNRVNIMEQLIQHRYDMFVESGIKTHFSTNLVDGDEIEKIYGPRIRGRLREMCNFFDFDTENHVDRRK